MIISSIYGLVISIKMWIEDPGLIDSIHLHTAARSISIYSIFSLILGLEKG